MLAIRTARRQRGFGLVELMITIAILAILVVQAVPAIGDWLLNSQIRTASEALQNGLQVARAEAVRSNVAVEFTLGGGSSWTVRLANGGATVQSRPSGEGSAQAVVTVVPLGATTVTFDGLGRVAANADASASLAQINVDLPPAILPAARTRDLQIVIGTGGQIRMCDPNVSDPTDPRKC